MKSKFLSVQDKSFLQDVQQFFEDLQLGMSAHQIKHFVLNDESFPLPDSKYHQAKLELYSRWQKIVDLEFSYRKNRAQCKLVQANIRKWESCLNTEIEHEAMEARAQIELLQIDLEQLQTARLFLQKSRAETFREMRIFKEVIEETGPHLIYENKEAAEADHWRTVHALRGPQSGSAPRPMPFTPNSR